MEEILPVNSVHGRLQDIRKRIASSNQLLRHRRLKLTLDVIRHCNIALWFQGQWLK